MVKYPKVKQVKRLFKEFAPEHYKLYLAPDRKTMTFTGRVVINGRKTGRPSFRITLHQKDLKVTSAKITKNDKRTGVSEIPITRINTQKSFDELRLHSSEQIFPGQYTIELEFTGKITEPMHGIYPCNFEVDGQKKQLIATQFESHHAREAFPCIDEPEAKATFDLILTTPAGETVIANTPMKSQTKKGSNLETAFETTPKMSTYLLAFVYGDLKYKEAKTAGGAKVRIYATPDKIELSDFALDVCVKALDFYEDYFGVPYPLPKLDIIGLPDFSSGAMENWGLVTFRESVLYAHPKHSSIETKQFICMVVSHELAHQWFGNLVTMRWWNDLWLNESFANLMEYRATDELFPEWKIWEEFTAREMGMALNRDSLPNVQSVRIDVHHPDELSSVFDPAIVYAKGGCMLNMARNLIGEDAFRAGLKSYFEEFKYKNTEAEDLWKHLGAASGVDVGGLMGDWLNQPGYPVVEAELNKESSEVALRQQRLVVGTALAEQKSTWQVPLAAAWELKKPLLKKPREIIKLTPAKDYPLVLNHDAHSYFAARYTNPEHFQTILKAASDQTLSTIDRLLLVQSYILLEKAGLVASTENLELLKAFANEETEAVWSVMAGIIGGARTLVNRNQTAEDHLNSLVRPMVAPLIKRLGWDSSAEDSSQTLKLRSLALSLAAASQDEAVIAEGLKRFKKFNQPSDLAPDIRSIVYFIAVRHGRASNFKQLVGLHAKLTNADERDEVASEITSAKQSAQIDELLKLITTDAVRLQDVPTWFAWLMRNRYATDKTWRWLDDNWQWIAQKYGDDKSYDRFPRYAAMAFSYPEQLETYKEFFKDKKNIALERPISLGIEEIEGRLAWRRKNQTAAEKWLAKNA